MIKPSIGRVVLFRAADASLTGKGDPLAEVPALITEVHSDTCVSLMVQKFGHGTTPVGVTSVQMAEEGEQAAYPLSWRWMPYQKEQAASLGGSMRPITDAEIAAQKLDAK